MSAIDVIEKICNTSIINSNLKYCLVAKDKKPYTINNTLARPNNVDDFVSIEELLCCNNLENYEGIGISIQGSDICAIDVDHCFSIKNDINSGDERAKYCLDLFKDLAYCEFSFSGTGLRILFKQDLIDDYNELYYIKNENCKIEYYQPSKSFRYVTITGNVIYNNSISSKVDFRDTIMDFLNKYMKRNKVISYKTKIVSNETRTYEELMKIVKKFYRKDNHFQELWFNHAPGSGKDESERDYQIIAFLYENVTQDKDLLKKLFESSDFFKTKDFKHIRKWNYQDFRYYDYIYNSILRTH